MRSARGHRVFRFFLPLACALLVSGTVSLAAATAVAGDPPTTSLIWVDSADREALRSLAAIDVPPVLVVDSGGFSLAWGDASRIDAVCSAGFDAVPLAQRRKDRAYALVFLRGIGRGAPIVKLESIGEILWSDPDACVLAYDPSHDSILWQSYEILRIPDAPARLAPAARLQARVPAAPDPEIASLVAKVESARLEAITQHLQDYGSRASNSAGGVEAGNWIVEQFRGFGLTDVTLHDYNGWCDNVVAVQAGRTQPGEIYVLGAHYDSWSRGGAAPGADDNATGTAGVLEVARIFAREQFEATIIYIAFSGEEQGLVGSDAWARDAASRGLGIRGMVNLDMLGYRRPGDPLDLDIISNAISTQLRDLAFDVVAAYVDGLEPLDGYLASGGSDHMSFWGQDYPALFFHEDSDAHSPYIHTPQDVIGVSVNDMDLFTRCVRATAGMMATLARPLRVRIDHAALADPPAGGNGYSLDATIESLVPLREDSLGAFYRADGGAFRWLPLRRVPGSEHDYRARMPRQISGTMIEYYLRGRDVEGRWTNVPAEAPARLHSFVVGRETRFEDDFSQDRGWAVGDAGDGASMGIWERAVPRAGGPQPPTDASGDSSGWCYLTQSGEPDEEAGESDVDGGRTSLLSPPIDLAGAARVSLDFDLWFVNETHVDDRLRVELSNDGGTTWSLLDEAAEAGRRWSRRSYADLDAFVAPTSAMRLRIVASDEGEPSLVEVAIDNVRIRSVPPSFEPPLGGRARIVAAMPSPFRSSTTILYDLPEDAAVEFQVHDVAGRLVARLAPIAAGEGRHELYWDGAAVTGASAPAGHYWITMRRSGTVLSAFHVTRIS